MKSVTFVVTIIAVVSLGRLSAGREWFDASGRHKVVAEYIDVVDGNVRLKRKDGTTIDVPLARLSPKDRAWVASVRGKASTEQSRSENGFHRLEGNWSIVSANYGNDNSISLASKETPVVTFFLGKNASEGTCSVTSKDARDLIGYLELISMPRQSTIKIDSTTDPAAIDFIASKGKTVRGIIKFESDGEMVLCIASDERPTDFGEKVGDSLIVSTGVLLTLKRIDATGEPPPLERAKRFP